MQKSYVSKYNGWLIINKNIGISSAKVVNKIKKVMDITKGAADCKLISEIVRSYLT